MNREEIIIILIMSYLGKPYIWGGNDPINGFDCSGAMIEILTSIGIGPNVDLTAQGLYYHYLSKNKVSYNISLGSLLFFGDSTDKIKHVSMAISKEHMFEFGGGNRKVTNREAAIHYNAYGRIRPISSRKDLVAHILPDDLL